VPCSSGEEPYSSPSTSWKTGPTPIARTSRSLASDIDSAILAAATAGVYASDPCSGFRRDLIRRYFTRQKDDQYCISDDIRNSIDFSQGNVRRSPLHAYVPRRRRHLLPQHADLFRRPVAARNRSRRCTTACRRRLHLPRPLGKHEPDIVVFPARKFADSIIYQKATSMRISSHSQTQGARARGRGRHHDAHVLPPMSLSEPASTSRKRSTAWKASNEP